MGMLSGDLMPPVMWLLPVMGLVSPGRRPLVFRVRQYGQEVLFSFCFLKEVYVSVYLCVAMCTSPQSPEAMHLLELELQMVVSPSTMGAGN